MWFWVVVLVLLVGAVAVVAAGRDNSMAEAYDDRPDRTVPAGRPLTAADLQAVRFSSAVRGYRMDEVDALIDRIAADLEARDDTAVPRTPSDGPGPEESARPQRSPVVAHQADVDDEAPGQRSDPAGHDTPR